MLIRASWSHLSMIPKNEPSYKELNVQLMYARRKLYGDEKSTYFEIGQVVMKSPSIRTFTITAIGKLTPDNHRSISLKAGDGEVIELDEEDLVREYSVLAK